MSIDERVERILESTPLIDTHVDLPILVRARYNNHIYGSNFTFREGLKGHVDIPRMKQGRVGGIFWSVFMPCPKNTSDFSDATYYELVHDTLQQIDLVHRLVDPHSDVLSLAVTSHQATAAHAHGKVASMIGVEGLHQVGNSASIAREYFALGVRYITLTHVCNNKYADGATAPEGAVWNGLSQDGEAMVKEMNLMGMMVDISHVTADTMRDVLKVTKAPVIFSHSSAYAICPHPRNVPDDVLQSVKANNGVVQVNFYNRFVHCKPDEDPKDATLAHVADHIQHIGELIGWDHVGIGSDFDGIDMTPKGLEDVSKYPDLFKELLSRGVTDEQARKVAGENILRVWRDVEKVAQEMQKAGVEPLEDDVAPLLGPE
ncbi:putative dipeptidase [Sphaerosporella brunnea]|uniref:Dipeptidase n=1 Tax=Sphaerosporella brunnea TaxID=1250544 RepID=A0A5J5EIY4_9PEZI|nr:putative dipeptidase [Sphaerosporella brunnea]